MENRKTGNNADMTPAEKRGLLNRAGAIGTGGTVLLVTGFIFPLGAIAIPIAAAAEVIGAAATNAVGKKVFRD